MKNLGPQILLGSFAALAVGWGIMARSWETFFALSIIFLFFAVWHVGNFVARSARRALRIAGYTISCACSITVAAVVVLSAEQAYFMNGSTYPSWLATADLGTVQHNVDLFNVARPQCESKGSTIILGKDNGLVAIRCGSFSWLGSKTYVAHLETPR